MDGIHDLGGVQGFGKVPHTINSESYKPVFHEDWEHLGYSLTVVAGGLLGAYATDELRHAIERMSARQYFSAPYFDRIIVGTATLLVEKGLITQEELDEALGSHFQLAVPSNNNGRPAPAKANTAPFEIGEQVHVRDEHVEGHIRVPGYCRGKSGTVLHRTTVSWPFPDTIGHGDQSAEHQPTYHVEFSAKELWGEEAREGSVVIDLFEGYLTRIAAADDQSQTQTAPAQA